MGSARGWSDDLASAVRTGRLPQLVGAYLADVRHRGLSAQTASAYRRPLQELVRFLARRRVYTLARVRDCHLVNWAFHMKHDRVSAYPWTAARIRPTTIHGYLSIVRRFFTWLVDQGILLASPAQGIGLRDLQRDPVGRITVPSEAQMRTLLNDAPSVELIELRDLAVLELAYTAGLRIGEIRALDLSDVDLDQRLVWVRHGKGGKDRVVPIGEPAYDALVQWLDVSRPQLARDRVEQAVFVTYAGQRLGICTMSERLQRLQRLLGLPAFRVHDLRHASALHMLRHGADLRHVQVLLGHATLKPTQIYTRLEPADLKAVHRKAHPRERHKERA